MIGSLTQMRSLWLLASGTAKRPWPSSKWWVQGLTWRAGTQKISSTVYVGCSDSVLCLGTLQQVGVYLYLFDSVFLVLSVRIKLNRVNA